MAFQLTNIASALERAEEAIAEAGRHGTLSGAGRMNQSQKKNNLNVIDALQRIEHIIRERRDTVTDQ